MDSTGRVTGVSPGTADITVTETESGKNRRVTVTVGASNNAGGVISFIGTPTGRPFPGIYAMRGDGSGVTDIYPDQSLNNRWYAPTVSPNRQYVALAYHGGADIYDHLFVVKTDGTGRQNLTIGYDAKWFPSSHRLAFRREAAGYNLYLINNDGTGETLVSNLNVGGYAVSPNGSKIAFSGSAPGAGSSNVYVYDVGTGSTITLTTGYSPTWSPDGQWLAYGSSSGIHMIKPDGTGGYILPGIASAGYVDWR